MKMNYKKEDWVLISICKGGRDLELLYQYRVPRSMWKRYFWVFRWRTSLLQCKFPKETVGSHLSFYYPLTAERQVKEIKSRIAGLRGWVTKHQNAIDLFVSRGKTEIFFDPESDPDYNKIMNKIDLKNKQILQEEENLKRIQL